MISFVFVTSKCKVMTFFLSADWLPFSAQVTTQELRLLEGQGVDYVTITSSVPPRLFCAMANRGRDTCKFRISTTILTDRPLKCADRKEVMQSA